MEFIPKTKNEEDRKLWLHEVKNFKNKLEEISGKQITLSLLKKSTEIVNHKRKALQRLSSLRA